MSSDELTNTGSPQHVDAVANAYLYAEPNPAPKNEQVPYRTIFATIACIIGTYLAWRFMQRTSYVLELIIISIFIALSLNPLVDFCERRLHLQRLAATSFVYITGLLCVMGLSYFFINPLVGQTEQLVNKLPAIARDASDGKGTVGKIVKRYHIDEYVERNQASLRTALEQSTGSIVNVVRKVANTLFTLVTVLVLGFMMLLYGRELIRAPLILFRPEDQMRISAVSAEAAKAVTGYMLGNIFISIIAGAIAYILLSFLGVPFAFVLAVFIAFCDLIPMFGATIGAVVTSIVAALHNPIAGVIAIVGLTIYQQVENHFIQPNVMARTVKLNPLIVLVSALVGVEYAGLLGALLAIPVAGAIQVIGKDLIAHRKNPFRGEVVAQQQQAEPTT